MNYDAFAQKYCIRLRWHGPLNASIPFRPHYCQTINKIRSDKQKKTHSPVGARRSNTITETATALAWSAITRPSRQRRVDEVTTMCCLILIHSKQMWFAFSSKRYVVYVYSVPFSTAPLGLEQRAPPKPKEVETRTKKKKKLSLRLPAETKQSKEIRSNSLNGRKNRELRKENHVLAMGRRLNAKRRIEFPRYSPAVNKQKKTKWKDQKKRWRKRRRYRAGVVVVGVVGLNIMLLGCWFALFFFCSCDNVLWDVRNATISFNSFDSETIRERSILSVRPTGAALPWLPRLQCSPGAIRFVTWFTNGAQSHRIGHGPRDGIVVFR